MFSLFEILSQLVGGSLIFWPLLNSLAIIALFLYWIFFGQKRKPEKITFYLFCLFASLYLLKIIGTIYSSDLKTAGFKLQQTSALLVLPLIYAFSSLQRNRFSRTMDFFSICCTAGVLAGLGWGVVRLFNTGSLHHLQGYDLVILKGMAPYIFGLCCLTSMSWNAYRLELDGRTVNKIFWLRISLLLLFTLFLLLLGNRLSIMLLFFLVLIYFFKTNFRKSYKIAGLSLVVFLVMAMGMVTPKLQQQWNEIRAISKQQMIRLDEDSSLGRSWGGGVLRLAIWQCAFDVFQEHPLAGVGTGDAQQALQESYEKRKFYFASRYNKYNAHNQYIQQLVTHGLPGLLLLIACIATGLVIAFRSGNDLALFFWVCFGVACFTESILEINKGIVWFSFFGSLFGLQSNNDQLPTPK
jgi:O-antigen ligase